MSPKRLAPMLTTLRTAKGLTQDQLRKRARISRGYLADLEAGHRKNPSLAILRRLAKALGVPLTELLG